MINGSELGTADRDCAFEVLHLPSVVVSAVDRIHRALRFDVLSCVDNEVR